LGAGAILRKDNDTITGLTTAAMIWGAASIGIAVGAGFYIEAAFAVISVMFVVEVLAPILSKFGPKRLRSKEVPCTIILADKSNIADVIAYFDEIKMTVEHMKIRQIINKDKLIKHEMELRLSTTSEKPIIQFYN
ncbi:MgtC/SapB family protein, partial [Microvirga sp. 3-52]|nr:MgtC/SapB family protein [Microvirga sp. 3-52]